MTREVIIETDKSTEDIAKNLFDTAFELAGEIEQLDYELGAVIGGVRINVEVKIEEAEEDE